MHLPMESYYRIPGLDENNIAEETKPLIVNCCGRVVMDHGFVTKSPRGRNDYYLLYMWSGKMRIRSHEADLRALRGKKRVRRTEWQDLDAGKMILLPPQTAYYYESLSGEVTYYWIHFTGSYAAELFRIVSPEIKILNPGLHESVETAFADLFTNFIMRDEFFEIENHALLMQILRDLTRPLRLEETINRRRARIAASLQYIHRNIALNLSVEELADMEHISPSRYRTIFRESMGTSPSDYIISQRIHRACELLGHFDLTIAEVAAAVGYNDPLYFSRLFKKKMGMSPSAYLAGLMR